MQVLTGGSLPPRDELHRRDPSLELCKRRRAVFGRLVERFNNQPNTLSLVEAQIPTIGFYTWCLSRWATLVRGRPTTGSPNIAYRSERPVDG